MSKVGLGKGDFIGDRVVAMIIGLDQSMVEYS